MYKVEIFTDKLEFVSSELIDERVTIELDYLVYDTYDLELVKADVSKGDYIHITKDNELVADGVVADVQPNKNSKTISVRALQTIFDADTFFNPINDCITWLGETITNYFIETTDTSQVRPINLTYTPDTRSLPLTGGFDYNEEINILSVISHALKKYGVVTDMHLDLTEKEIVCNIYRQTATQVIEADLDNVLEASVTLGDNVSAINKLYVRKEKIENDVPVYYTPIEFYLHPDGSINRTNSNRIVPVYWALSTITQNEDMTDSEWLAKAQEEANEKLASEQYDNEIVLEYHAGDKVVFPKAMAIGTATSIYLNGEVYPSILTGKSITRNSIVLTFGIVRVELTKKLIMENKKSSSSKSSSSSSSGGGGGTADYNYLQNKPQIEGVTLSGNKTFPNLNLSPLTNTQIENLLT